MAREKKESRKEEKYLLRQQQNVEEDTIDLLRLIKALWHRAWAIILSAILFGGVAFGYAAFLITPTYQSQVMIYVNNSSISFGNTSVSISSSEIYAAQSLADTYVVILESRTTLEQVIEEAGLDCTYSELLAMISADSVNSTEIFSVTVTNSDPVMAAEIANTIAEILPDRIAEIVEGSSVVIVDTAVAATSKSSPSITKYTAIGILAGIVLSCFIIVVLELMDDVIHDEDYLIETYNIPVLAVIPDLTAKKKSGYYSSYYGKDRRDGN